MVDILGKVGFDWHVALANLINFLIVFFLIKKFLWKPIKKNIKERQEIVDKGLEDAKRASAALTMAETEKESIIQNAYQESREIIENADKQGQKIISESKKEGADDAEKIRETAQHDAEKIKLDAEKKLQKEYASLVALGIEKVAMMEVDKEKSEQFSRDLLK